MHTKPSDLVSETPSRRTTTLAKHLDGSNTNNLGNAFASMATQAVQRLNELTAEILPLDEALVSLIFLLRNPRVQHMISRVFINFQASNDAGDAEELWMQLHTAISSFLNSEKALSRLQSDSLLHRLSIVWLALLLLTSASRILHLKTLEDAVHLLSTLIAKALHLNQRFFITKQVVQHVNSEQILPPSFCTATAVGELFILLSEVVERMFTGNKKGQFSSTASFVSIVARFFETVMNGIMCYAELAVQGDLETAAAKQPSPQSSSTTNTSSDSSFFSSLAPSNHTTTTTTTVTTDKIRKVWDSDLLGGSTQESNPLRILFDTRALDAMLVDAVGMSSSTMLKYFVAALRQFRKSGNFRSIMRVVGQMLATQSSLTVAVRSLMGRKSSLFNDESSLKWERDNILQVLFELLSRLSVGDPKENTGLFNTYRGIVTTAAHVLYTRFLQDTPTGRRRQPRRASSEKSQPEPVPALSESPLETLLGKAMSEGQ